MHCFDISDGRAVTEDAAHHGWPSQQRQGPVSSIMQQQEQQYVGNIKAAAAAQTAQTLKLSAKRAKHKHVASYEESKARRQACSNVALLAMLHIRLISSILYGVQPVYAFRNLAWKAM